VDAASAFIDRILAEDQQTPSKPHGALHPTAVVIGKAL
jgi:hypothetical protein